jgi:zinc protease
VQTSGTATAVGEILREMTDIAAERPAADRELAMARASLTRGYARNFETAEQVGRGLAQLAIYGLPDTWFDEFVDRIDRIDGGMVLDAARRHLRPGDALVTIVGDRQRVEDGVTALGFDTVTIATPA